MVKDETINILYVDDEANNLKAFKASFRRYFTVYLAKSAKDAEVILAKKKIHILITDQRMPVTLGTELLAEAVKKYPEQIRILLTAFSDDKAVQVAVNKGYIFKALQKPWNHDELKKEIEDGYEEFSLLSKRNILSKQLHIENQDLSFALKQKEDSTKKI
jgi:response regulator RpfG family c-di-GMP phosphodiesterase